MSVMDDLAQAKTKLGELETELAATRGKVDKLAGRVNLRELAKVKLAGGAIYLHAGELHQLQAARLSVSILEQAIELQQLRLEQREQLAAQLELATLAARRDEVVQQVAQSLAGIQGLVSELEQLDARLSSEDDRNSTSSAADHSALSHRLRNLAGRLEPAAAAPRLRAFPDAA